ncbi:MAG: HAD-IA family hydrolase, partial [Clostridia bacterium]|nr:HAD-IA family hydrolase [Clostridia bacterium]
YITRFYGLDKYFKNKIVSGDVHCRKPDQKIYDIALKQIQAEANECLFIDDNINNILSAQKLGINSILFNRYNEQYTGEQVHSFEELAQVLLLL